MKSALALCLAFAPAIAHAGCPVTADPDDEARLAWIQAQLARSSHRATVWLRGWEIGIVGATAANLAMLPILGDTKSNRIDFGLGAATTIVGIVPLIFWRPRVIDDHEALEAASQNLDRCALLADVEHRLVASAAAQSTQRAWYMHAGNVVLNLGVTLLFGAFHHWTTGILSGAGGAVIGEAIIFTEPVDQIDALASYRQGLALTF